MPLDTRPRMAPGPCWMVVAALIAWIVSPASVAAQADNSVTVRQLQQELAKRDAIIIDLLNRVRALEKDNASERGKTFGPGAADREPAPVANAPESQANEGDREIDPLQAERALERSLVQQGVRLLNPAQVQLTPGFMFSRYEGDFPTVLMTPEQNVVGEHDRAFDVYDSRTDLRIGLPSRLQLELGLPYRRVHEQVRIRVDGVVQATENRSGAGLGDITLGLARSFTAGDSGRPRVIGRLTWLSGSGDERDGTVSLGGGMAGAAAQLSAYWRRDPVVFLLSGGYTHYFRAGATQPGDSMNASLGLALAVSPETALTFSLDQARARAFARDGVELSGTGRLSSSLRLSASTILGRRLLLLVNAGVGLTQDTPNYGFGVSLSSRFARR